MAFVGLQCLLCLAMLFYQPAAVAQGVAGVDPVVEEIPEGQEATWTDAAGTPIPGLVIKFVRHLGPTLEFTSNRQGQTYRIQSSNNYRMNRVIAASHDRVFLSHEQFKVDVHPGQSDSYSDKSRVMLPFFMPGGPANEISGTVLDPEGKPLANAKVRVAIAVHDRGRSIINSPYWLVTGADGGFGLSAQASLKTDPAKLTGLYFLVEVLAAGITGPVAQRAKVQPGQPVTIKLEKPPTRRMILVDSHGVALSEAATDEAMQWASVWYQSPEETDPDSSVRFKLTSLKSAALPAGTYKLFCWRGQFGPTVLPADPTVDLVFQAPPPVVTRLTVLDGFTNKPAANTPVLVSTEALSAPIYFAYLSDEEWQEIMAVTSPSQTMRLSDSLKRWFAGLGRHFAVLTTDEKGQVDVNLARTNGSAGLNAMVLRKGEFLRPTRIKVVRTKDTSADEPLLIPAESTAYRYAAATVLIKPVHRGTLHQRYYFQAQLAIDPAADEKFKARFPSPFWQDHSIEAGALHTLHVPAGVPIRLDLTRNHNVHYQSPLIDLAPGQVLDLKFDAFTQIIKYTLLCQTKDGSNINGKVFYIKGPDGTFKPIAADTKTGIFPVLFPSFGTYTIGFHWHGQKLEDPPRFQSSFSIHEGQTETNLMVKFDITHSTLYGSR